MYPRLMINDNLIAKEQMHSFDASYLEPRIKVRFVYKDNSPNHDLVKNESYNIKLTDTKVNIEIGIYKLVNIILVHDGPIKFKTYHFTKVSQ